MQRQAIAARARPDVMQPGTRANGEAMGAGPSVYSGDAAAALYFYQQYGPMIYTVGACLCALSVFAAFSADGATVVTASGAGAANIWNACTGQCTQTLSGHGQCVTSAAFSADGATVVTTSVDGAAKIWNACTRQCTQTLSGHRHGQYVTSAAFSADGATVLTASADGAARI